MVDTGPRPHAYTRYVLPAEEDMPRSGGWWNIDMYVRWEHIDPPRPDQNEGDGNVFLACHFGLDGPQGGYIGIQQYGRRWDERYARFSMWDAGPDARTRPLGDSPYAQRVEDGGTATTFKLPYPWQVGREYRLRVWAVPDVPGWVGSIYDVAARRNTVIGTIETPPVGYRRIARHVNVFTEYFTTHSGADKPYSRAVWRGPYANNGTSPFLNAVAGYGTSTTNTYARGERRPVVIHETGGDVQRINREGDMLW